MKNTYYMESKNINFNTFISNWGSYWSRQSNGGFHYSLDYNFTWNCSHGVS